MDEGLQLLVEMHQMAWNRFQDDVKDLAPEEIDWRPLPEANNINGIVRHLRIEAHWHLASLERGENTPPVAYASVPLDFERNLRELDDLYTRFVAALGQLTPAALRRQSALAYQEYPNPAARPPHMLGFHQALHLAAHWGQIRTIRNLYAKTRGRPARFFPENPAFPA